MIKERLIINKQNGKFNFYPTEVFNLLKKNDILDVGFEGLQLKILSKNKNAIKLTMTGKELNFPEILVFGWARASFISVTR